MSNLVVVAFDEPHKAEEVRLKLAHLHSHYLLDLWEVVVATKDERGKVKLHRAGDLTARDTFSLGFCGSLASLILLNATAGVGTGALREVGIDDQFMKELTATLIPSSSALFVRTRTPTPDKEQLLQEVKGLGGKILMTSLSHEDEARLQAALNTAKPPSP
jgi:uncharacterized membrane protein